MWCVVLVILINIQFYTLSFDCRILSYYMHFRQSISTSTQFTGFHAMLSPINVQIAYLHHRQITLLLHLYSFYVISVTESWSINGLSKIVEIPHALNFFVFKPFFSIFNSILIMVQFPECEALDHARLQRSLFRHQMP